MLDTAILTQDSITSNGQTPRIIPAVWGEYTLRQNPTLYSAVMNYPSGAVMGTLGYDRSAGYYVREAMTADKEYVPAFDGWDNYIAADVDTLNAEARGQIATEVAA